MPVAVRLVERIDRWITENRPADATPRLAEPQA